MGVAMPADEHIEAFFGDVACPYCDHTLTRISVEVERAKYYYLECIRSSCDSGTGVKYRAPTVTL